MSGSSVSRQGRPQLVVVSGYTGSGKSTMADAIAGEIGATTVSFDWVMSALRSFPEVWSTVEAPIERQRSVAWTLMARVAEQQLRAHRSVVLDLVARSAAIDLWSPIAQRYDAALSVVECVCSNPTVQMSRVVGRTRQIPGWYELRAADVERSRANYQPLREPKVVIDAMNPLEDNLRVVLAHLEQLPGD